MATATRSWIRCVGLLGSLLLATVLACSSRGRQLYEGEQRPSEETALILAESDFYVRRVDGKMLFDRDDESWRPGEHRVEVLPGRHEIVLACAVKRQETRTEVDLVWTLLGAGVNASQEYVQFDLPVMTDFTYEHIVELALLSHTCEFKKGRTYYYGRMRPVPDLIADLPKYRDRWIKSHTLIGRAKIRVKAPGQDPPYVWQHDALYLIDRSILDAIVKRAKKKKAGEKGAKP